MLIIIEVFDLAHSCFGDFREVIGLPFVKYSDSDVATEIQERMEQVRTRKRTRRRSLALNASVLTRNRRGAQKQPAPAVVLINDGQVSTVIVPSNVEKPKFTGNEIIPMQFLINFERYAAHFKWNDVQKLSAVLSCLVEDAALWAQLFLGRWGTFADFTEDFKNQYWSEEIQCTIRGRIESDHWDRKIHPTMSTHFAYYAGLARALSPPMPETQLVNAIMKHFPFSVQTGWMAPGNKTIFDTMQYLTRQNEMFKRGRHGNKPREINVNVQEVRQTERKSNDNVNSQRPHHKDYRRSPLYQQPKRSRRRSRDRRRPYQDRRRSSPDRRRPYRDQRRLSRDQRRSPSEEKKEKSSKTEESSPSYNQVPPPRAGNSPGQSAKKKKR